jgi:hypothetical protein
MHHQPIRGDQQDFKEHKQIEQIAGQERAVEPHQLELNSG